MIRKIKNLNRDVQYIVNTNLRDIVVLVQEKLHSMEWVDKMKMKFRVVDEYDTITNENGISYIKKIEINGETINLFTVENYSLDDMIEIVNNKYREDKLIEEMVNSHMKSAKTIEFIDERDEKKKKIEDIVNMR